MGLEHFLRHTEFEKEKKEVNRILAENGGEFPNDGKIDSGIRDLVYKINEFPFVYTEYSCSGHFSTREDIYKKHGNQERGLILPTEGCGFYFNGKMGLMFNQKDNKTEKYVSEIKKVIENYPNASIEETGSEVIIKFDNLKNPIRHRPAIIPIDEGIERIEVVKNLIEDLHSIFIKK